MNFFFLTLTKYRINPGLFAYFFFGGGGCVLENLRTWGKWYLTFFYLRQSFLLQGNNTIYKFCVLYFWRTVLAKKRKLQNIELI